MQKHFVKFVVGVAAAVAVFLLGLSFGNLPQSVSTAVSQPATGASLLINNGEFIHSYANEPLPQPPTVLGLLEQITEREKIALDVDRSSSLGAFVKQIGEEVNGQRGMYWQYWVNGKQPLVAADRLELMGGETVFWTFSKSER